MHGMSGLREPESYVYDGECIWYALLTEAGRERRACVWLERRQFKPYWPRYRAHVKLNRHRRAIRVRGVIPGYMFLPIPVAHTVNCGLIESSPGVRRIMRNGGGVPVVIPALGKDGIEKIREIEQSLNESAVAAADGIPFKVGQRIRVPRLELEGKILSIERGRRVFAELYMFGALRSIPLPVDEIEAA